MRNISMALICLMMTFVTYANVTDSNTAIVKGSEIYRVIMASKEANVPNGIIDPNKILPQQTLTFRFADGSTTTHIVSSGETQWAIVDDLLTNGVPQHGPIVNYNDTTQHAQTTPISGAGSTPIVWQSAEMPWWVYALVAFGVITLLFFLFRKQFGNPANGGPRMRQEGITQQNRNEVMQEIAQRQFPGRNVRVLSTQSGYIHGTNVQVYYGGDTTPQRRTFRNQPGVRAVVIVEGNLLPQTVYGLMACANDVRMGNYFIGSVRFTEAEVSQPVRQEQNAQTQTAAVFATEDKPSFQSLCDVLPEILQANTDSQTTEIVFTNGQLTLEIKLTAKQPPLALLPASEKKEVAAEQTA